MNKKLIIGAVIVVLAIAVFAMTGKKDEAPAPTAATGNSEVVASTANIANLLCCRSIIEQQDRK